MSFQNYSEQVLTSMLVHSEEQCSPERKIFSFWLDATPDLKCLLLFVSLTLGCTAVKSGLTIPANETFILGESNSKNYSAELVNTSDYEVKIRGEKKQNGEYTQGFGLAPKGKVTVYVSSDEIIKFINNNNLPVKVNVKMSKEVYGMRYIKN